MNKIPPKLLPIGFECIALSLVLLSACRNEESKNRSDTRIKEYSPGSDSLGARNRSTDSLAGFIGHKKGWVKIRDGESSCRPTIEQSYTRYFYQDGALLAAAITEGEGCFEGKMPADIHVTSVPLHGNTPDFRNPNWEVRDTGDEVGIFDFRYLTINEPGCCASIDITKFYSIKNGAYLGRGGPEFKSFDIGGNRHRLLVAEQSRNTGSAVPESSIKLFLADTDAILDTLAMDSTIVPQFQGCPHTFLDRMSKESGKRDSAAQIRLEFDCYGEEERRVTIFLEITDSIQVVSDRP